MKIANAKDGYGLCVCAKEGIGYANKGCNLKGGTTRRVGIGK